MSVLDCVFIQRLAFTFTFLKQRVQSAVVLFNDVFNPPADFQVAIGMQLLEFLEVNETGDCSSSNNSIALLLLVNREYKAKY